MKTAKNMFRMTVSALATVAAVAASNLRIRADERCLIMEFKLNRSLHPMVDRVAAMLSGTKADSRAD